MLATDYSQDRHVHFPNVEIKIIPHREQRYETPGDYWDDFSGTKQIRVSESKPHYEFLIAVHELVESYLVAAKGIGENSITEFDKRFEEMRKMYPDLVADAEPGDNDAAPYFHEHAMATRIERWLASSLGIEWEEYSKEIDSLKSKDIQKIVEKTPNIESNAAILLLPAAGHTSESVL